MRRPRKPPSLAIDTLVVWRLDRLARSLKQLIETVEMLEEKGVGFRVSVRN